MELNNQKPFEKPDAGQFAGTIIDVVDLPNYPSQYGPKNKIRIVWVLGPAAPGQKTLDSEGKPYQVIGMYNASISEKASLFKAISMILNAAPPLMTTTEQVAQLLIGRSNLLFLTKTPNPKIQGDFYVNIAAIMPLPAGFPIPQAPQGFIRTKDRVKTVAGPNGQPVQTFAQPPQQFQTPAQQFPTAAPTQQFQAPPAPAGAPGQPAPFVPPPSNNLKW